MLLWSICNIGYSQTNPRIEELLNQRQIVLNIKDSLDALIENAKLEDVIFRIHKYALPKLEVDDSLICHSAACLVFSHEHKLAKWVVHILSSDIIEGRVSRTNDFRNDPLIPNTANESDYFVKTLLDDGKYKYEGFGYDRGHLAPSADFRWSSKALSESYYYSNITPQTPEFNREKWAEIEDFLRSYVYDNPNSYLYIITAPVLEDNLPVIEKSPNRIPIPHYHYKIAVDLDKKNGIAFLVPQRNITYPIESYIVPIDSIEKITGIDFFTSLSSEDQKWIESNSDYSKWAPESQKNDVAPLLTNQLPKNAYNTVEAAQFYDYPKEVKICGTVASTHKSGKGNVFINLDKSFPKAIFSVTIWSKDVVNFNYEPELFLMNKKACFTGKITEYNGIPSMYISNQKKIEIID
ncbi:MAG: DNA/RNA non-specific endonuclease [Bacteroidales bacterium]|nr:DNA/RNA non-specific endonuclease [Bacteroidales bacterium]MDY0216089.1 DNA/RNA non-specific endonuclease [Bacteroidales bacterium]